MVLNEQQLKRNQKEHSLQEDDLYNEYPKKKQKFLSKIPLSAKVVTIIIVTIIITTLFNIIVLPLLHKKNNNLSVNYSNDDIEKKNDKTKADHNTLHNRINGVFVNIDPITIDLIPTNNDKKDTLQIKIILQLFSEKDAKAIVAQIPIIQDNIITFLRLLRSIDLHNSSSSIILKEEILKRVNKILYPIEVKEILIQEINLT